MSLSLVVLLLAGEMTAAGLPALVEAGDAVVVGTASPGFTPMYPKTAYVDVYGPLLTWKSNLFEYPWPYETPLAAVFSRSGDLYFGRRSASESDQYELWRLDAARERFLVATLPYAPSAIALDSRETLYVSFHARYQSGLPYDIARYSNSGELVKQWDLPGANGLVDFDLFADQCTLIYVGNPIFSGVRIADLCSEESNHRIVVAPEALQAVRILPSGHLLVSAKGRVYELGLDGTVHRTLFIGSGWPRFALDPNGTGFWAVVDGVNLIFISLDGPAQVGPIHIRGAGISTLAVAGEWRAAKSARRRPVRRHSDPLFK